MLQWRFADSSKQSGDHHVALMLLLSLASLASLALEPARAAAIRGVAPSKAHLYQPTDGNLFRCLDGSQTIPYARLNDDYCDCPDGSDEPGTSACPNGTFFCVNTGHIPSTIPSSYVNDGTCEAQCCDGSDEWLGIVSCPNICEEKHKEYSAIERERESVRSAGWKIREGWVHKAVGLRTKIEEDIVRKTVRLESTRINLKDRQHALEKIESQVQLHRKPNAAAEAIVQYKEAIKTLRKQIKNREARLEQYKDLMKGLAEGYNPNYQDMAVKYAVEEVKQWPDLDLSELSDETLDTLEAAVYDSYIESSHDIPLQSGNARFTAVTRFVSKIGLSRIWNPLIETLQKNMLTQTSFKTSGATTQDTSEVNNVKVHLESTQSQINTLESDIKDLKDSLSRNYGPDDIYRALAGECVSAELGGYTYEVCFLGSINQKSATMTTLVGTWHHIDEHGALVFEGGQRCWNGPERSARVQISCGARHEVLRVKEAQKCEYIITMKSPAACGPPDLLDPLEQAGQIGSIGSIGARDEL